MVGGEEGNKSGIPIIVDSREPQTICEIIERYCPVEVKVLEDGDYIIESSNYEYPFLFSRKTVSDLISSMNSGHWSDECSRLLEKYPFSSLLIVEGKIEDMRIRKSLWSMQVSIPISFTNNMEETVQCLLHYRKKIIEKEMGIVKRRPVLMGDVNPVISFYAQIPSVGVERARRIYKVYPRPYDLVNAIFSTFEWKQDKWKTEKEWKKSKWNAEIEGIGEDTAAKVETFILDGIVIK